MARSKLYLSPENLSLIAPAPYSRSARWGRNLGAFSILFALVALLFHIFGAVETPTFFTAIVTALCAATLAMLFSARGLAIIWVRGKRGLHDAILGLFYGVLLWTVPLTLLVIANTQPNVTDIATEGEPPVFLQVSGVRPEWAKPVDLSMVTPETLGRPLQTETPLAEVYELAKTLALQQGWTIVADRPPSGQQPASAALQLTARTLIGFTDDVVIWFNLDNKRTLVRMRSAGRIGPFDLGVNADRIDEFLLLLRQKLNER